MAPVCEHGGGIFLGGESLCGGCCREFLGVVFCSRAKTLAHPDRWGCKEWKPAASFDGLRWCFWCQSYQEQRWGGAPV